MAELTRQERESLRRMVISTADARLAAIRKVRVYRNAVVVTTLILFLAAVIFPLMAARLNVDFAALHFATPPAQPPHLTARDLWTTEAWGTLGALIAAVVGLRRLAASRGPAGLQLAQLVLKLPAGALTAVFGVVLVQSAVISQVSSFDDRKLAAYAMLFGFAQEAITRMVDRQAEQLAGRAQPISEREPHPV